MATQCSSRVVGDLSLHAEADDDKLFMHLVFLWREAGTFLKSYRLLTLISVTDKFKYEDIKIILQSNIITMRSENSVTVGSMGGQNIRNPNP